MAHLARDAGLPLAFQLLSVPGVDLNTVLPSGEIRPENPWQSYRELEYTAALPVARITYVLNHFLGNPRQKGVEEVKWIRLSFNIICSQEHRTGGCPLSIHPTLKISPQHWSLQQSWIRCETKELHMRKN